MAIKTKPERGPAGTLTVDDLTRAIKNSIDRTGTRSICSRTRASSRPSGRRRPCTTAASGESTTGCSGKTGSRSSSPRRRPRKRRRRAPPSTTTCPRTSGPRGRRSPRTSGEPSSERELQDASGPPHEIHREGVREVHPPVPVGERLSERLHGPQGLRREGVRDVRAVLQVAGRVEGDGEPKGFPFP